MLPPPGPLTSAPGSPCNAYSIEDRRLSTPKALSSLLSRPFSLFSSHFGCFGFDLTSFWKPQGLQNIANLTKQKRKAVSDNAYPIALYSYSSVGEVLSSSSSISFLIIQMPSRCIISHLLEQLLLISSLPSLYDLSSLTSLSSLSSLSYIS